MPALTAIFGAAASAIAPVCRTVLYGNIAQDMYSKVSGREGLVNPDAPSKDM